MSVATKRTVAELIHRSERLMRLAHELAEEYGIDIAELNNTEDLSKITNGNDKPKKKRRRKAIDFGMRRMPSRAKELKKYLESQGGSATRQQILHGTKIPEGTVGMLLTKYGKKREDGTWSWSEEKEKE